MSATRQTNDPGPKVLRPTRLEVEGVEDGWIVQLDVIVHKCARAREAAGGALAKWPMQLPNFASSFLALPNGKDKKAKGLSRRPEEADGKTLNNSLPRVGEVPTN